MTIYKIRRVDSFGEEHDIFVGGEKLASALDYLVRTKVDEDNSLTINISVVNYYPDSEDGDIWEPSW